MAARTFTLLVTIEAEPGHLMFDTYALADAVQAALEAGQKRAVIKGVECAAPAVAAATVHAYRDDRLECLPGTVGATAANGSGAAKRVHAALRASVAA